jgi:hypothetical protein
LYRPLWYENWLPLVTLDVALDSVISAVPVAPPSSTLGMAAAAASTIAVLNRLVNYLSLVLAGAIALCLFPSAEGDMESATASRRFGSETLAA